MTKARDISKLSAVEVNATADQTDAEVKAAVEAASDSNTFTDADHSKLNAIEASADVTDTVNVTSAGALMDSEITNLAEVKAFDSSDYATAAQGTLATNALPKAGGTITGNITQSDGDYLYSGGGNFDIKHTTASQNIVFSTTPSGGSATEVLRITHDGKLSKLSGNLTLDVAGDIILDADSNNWRFQDAGTSILEISKISNGASIYNAVADASMHFRGNDGGSAIQAMTIDYANGGRVGIGTASPAANLHVYSAGQAIARVEGSNQYYSGMMIRNNYSSTQSQWHVAAAGGSSGWGAANGNFIVRDDTTNSTAFEAERGAGGNSGAVYVDSSGTTTLTGTYSTTNSVNNVLRLNSTSSGTAVAGHGTGIQFLGTRNDGATQSLALIQSVTSTNSGTSIAADLTFHTGSGGAPSERMRLDDGGKLGLGTQDPQEEIHVMTSASSSIRASGQSNNNRKVEIGYDTADGPYLRGGSSGIVTLKFFIDNTVLAAKIADNADFYTNDGTVHSLSDIRVKTDVEDLVDGLDIVKQLKPRTFKYTKDSEFYTESKKDEISYGFVADEVEEVAPQYTDTGKGKIGDEEVDDLKSLSTTKMIPMLVKAIQEQQEVIESLTARITALEA